MSFVVGLDLSLTSTGLSAIDPEEGEPHTAALGSSGKSTAIYPEHLDRHISLCEDIVAGVERADPVAVALESASFSTPKDTSAHRRAGLWWRVYEAVSDRWPVVTLTPAEVKMFATGKGNASKEKVLAQTYVAYGVDPFPDACFDRADATVLASALTAYLGGKQGFALTAYREAVLDKLSLGREWPAVLGPRRHRTIVTEHLGA